MTSPITPESSQSPRHSLHPTQWLGSLASMLALFGLLGIAALVFLPMMSGLSDRNSQEHPGVGQKLPALELEPLTGVDKAVTLSDLEGRVLLVSFWGTWCGPCKMEMPHLANIAKAFAGETDFRFLAVSCGPGGREDIDELRAETELYLERSKLNIPTYADTKLVTRQAFDSVASLQGYPTTFLVDRQGVIRRVWVGYRSNLEEILQTAIPELLQEKNPGVPAHETAVSFAPRQRSYSAQ